MSAISSVSSMVNSLFSRIDTSNQGYIDKAGLKTAFQEITSSDSDSSSSSVDAIFDKFDSDSDGKLTKTEMTDGMTKLAQELNNQFNQSRLTNGTNSLENTSGYTKDELTSLIDQVGDSDSKRTSLMSSIVSNFDKADTDGNGKVSNEEAMAYDKTLQANATTTGSTDTTTSNTGYTKDELSALIEELGDTDSKRTSLMSSIVSNFDKADTDGDGKVSNAEAMAYDQSTSATSSTTTTAQAGAMPPPPPPGKPQDSGDSTSSSSSSSSSYDVADTNKDGVVSEQERIAYENSNATSQTENMSVMKMMVQLLQAYGTSSSSSTQTASSTISTVA